MEPADFEQLEEDLIAELYQILKKAAGDKRSMYLRDVQPPESVIRLMAQSAANTLVAYERGYQMPKA